MNTPSELSRDEIALRMNPSFIPALREDRHVEQVCKKYGWDMPDKHNAISVIQFTLKYQALISYEYADAMLAERVIKRNHKSNTQPKMEIVK